MNLEESIKFLNKKGYCLWVGTGVDIYLSQNSNYPVPDWLELVEIFENKAGLKDFPKNAKLQERLEVVLNKLNVFDFRKLLRKHTISQLAYSLYYQAKQNVVGVPDNVRVMGKLGLLANPIINFNVEVLSSVILSCGGGHYSIKFYGKKEYDEKLTMSRGTQFSKKDGNYIDQRFFRHIYHPHGNIDSYGVSVFTDEDYKKHTHSLAYQLATHSAFDENLLIVGMSLDDEYLMDHIERFRSEIKKIFWVTSNTLSDEKSKWCWRHDIDVICVQNWSEFWSKIDEVFPNTQEEALYQNWQNVIHECISIINDAYESERQLEMWMSMNNSEDVVKRQKLMLMKRGIEFSEGLDSELVISVEESNEVKTKMLERLLELLK